MNDNQTWHTAPLKYHTHINAETLPETTPSDYELEYIDIGSVNSQGEITSTQHMKFEYAPSRARRVVRNGDTIVSTVRTYLKAIAYIGEEKENLICSTGFAVLTPHEGIKNKFLAYFSRSNYFIDEIVSRSVGVSYPAVNASDIANIKVLIPPFNEQERIVYFLDRELAVIDNMVRKKERLIKLLQEKRQAIINEAVTKGLDPNVPMKDSGIEWLGTVPANWNLTKIKFITKIKGRIGFRGYTTEDIVNYREGALTLGAKHINKKYQIDLSDPEFISWEKYYESPEIMLKINDIVLVQRGSTVGKVAIINKDIGEATINPSLMVLKETTCVPQYLYYFLSSSYIRDNIKVVTSVTAIPMISQEQINNFVIVIPSLEEQLEIADYLKGQSKQIETIIDKINIQIKKIQEYRQSLISEAVTGKIDVAVMERRHNNDH
ncbi:restriction endonuclease subunit S [Paenibacillus illinoisensis]|uniref:restriction endonuclease subunit S n=1 Tax=Paenibacillus illinoisensis TaxID=59845 RepID=UPI00301DD510